MAKTTEISKQADEIAANINEEIITSLVLNGDISKMSGPQKVEYYNTFCRALTLNPITQPFEIINLNGKLRMYATKGCTDQLRRINGISVTQLETKQMGDTYIVIAYGQDRTGRIDSATGALNIKGLFGDNLANAIMKAETKAKRRLTLSLSGLGILDESELDTVAPEAPTRTEARKQDDAASVPQAPVEECLCTDEDMTTLQEILQHATFPEKIQDKFTPGAMLKALATKYEKGTLTKSKAEEYIKEFQKLLDDAIAAELEKEVEGGE